MDSMALPNQFGKAQSYNPNVSISKIAIIDKRSFIQDGAPGH
jgi:hypothetical protein